MERGAGREGRMPGASLLCLGGPTYLIRGPADSAENLTLAQAAHWRWLVQNTSTQQPASSSGISRES